MKYVTTAQPYRQLVIEPDEDGGDTRVVGRTPLKVSDADAKKIAELGEANGVRIVVSDDEDEAVSTVATSTPDLSAGIVAVTGGGSPVTNDQAGVVTDGTGNDSSAGTARTKGGK